MALRSLNAAAPERKRGMKKSRNVSSQTKNGAAVPNDENIAPTRTIVTRGLLAQAKAAAAASVVGLPVPSVSSNDGNIAPIKSAPSAVAPSATKNNSPLPVLASNNVNAAPPILTPFPDNSDVETAKVSRFPPPASIEANEVQSFTDVSQPAQECTAEVEYVLSENLPHLEDFEKTLSTLVERLDSKNWLTVCEALNNLRQLSIYHKQSLLPLLDETVPLVIKAMKNPRSALCKTSIMAAADLFRIYPEQIVKMLDQLLLQLLLKASQDKRFVLEEADASLQAMTSSLPSCLVLSHLKPYVTHRSPKVRAKAATCIYQSVKKLGHNGIKAYGFEVLLKIVSSQINDQLPEARESGRKLVHEIYESYKATLSVDDLPSYVTTNTESIVDDSESAPATPSIESSWERLCTSHLSPHVAHAIFKLTSASA